LKSPLHNAPNAIPPDLRAIDVTMETGRFFVTLKRLVCVLSLLAAASCSRVQWGFYRFNGDLTDPSFVDILNEIVDEPVAGGNDVELLVNGVQIFPAMEEAILGAKIYIHLETYIFYEDPTGRRFIDLLIKKAQEGVEVRIITDYFGCKLSQTTIDTMRKQGIKIHIFNPFSWLRLVRSSERDHRKILVVDGTTAFVGGVGLASHWEGDADGPDHWRETHAKIKGPVVRHIQREFVRMWEKVDGEKLGGPYYFPDTPPAGRKFCGVVGRHIDKKTWSRVRESFLLPLAAAKKYYYMNMAYFIPDPDCMTALREAVARGVDVRVILSGPYVDLKSSGLVASKNYGKLLPAGVKLYEYQGTNMHAKTLVVDDIFTSIGSANFDWRTFNWNYECNLVTYDRDLALQLKKLFLEDLEYSDEVTFSEWDRRPLRQRFLEQGVGIVEQWM